MPYTWSWSAGVSQELFGQMALSVDYVANASRDQLGVIDINEPVNGVRPGVAVFDPTGDAHSARGPRRQLPARAAVADQRRLRRRLQVAAGVAREAHVQPLERPPGLHPAAQQLRRHRQSRRAPGVARQRPARRLRRVQLQPHQRASPPAAPGTRGGRSPSRRWSAPSAARRSTRPSAATSTAISTTTIGRSPASTTCSGRSSRSSTRRAAPCRSASAGPARSWSTCRCAISCRSAAGSTASTSSSTCSTCSTA